MGRIVADVDTTRGARGDCIASIALHYGFFPETLWNHGDNADLRALRKDPYVLSPGDVVVVPDVEPKTVKAPTAVKHRFRRKGVPEKLSVVIEGLGRPRANAPYVLDLGGRKVTGTTSSVGLVEEWIPPDLHSASLQIEDDPPIELLLGHIDPVREPAGRRARLENLGFWPAESPGRSDDDALRIALEGFQETCGMPVTGVADDATDDRLVAEFGS